MSVLRRKSLMERQRKMLFLSLSKGQMLRRRNPQARVRNPRRRERDRRRTLKSHSQNQTNSDPLQNPSFPLRRNGILSSLQFPLQRTSPLPPRHKHLHFLQKRHPCMPPTFRITPLPGFLRVLLRTAGSCGTSCSPERCLIG